MYKIVCIHRNTKRFSMSFMKKLKEEALKSKKMVDICIIHSREDIKKDLLEFKLSAKIIKDKNFFGINLIKFIKSYDCVILLTPDNPWYFSEFIISIYRVKKNKQKAILWWNPPNWKDKWWKMFYWELRRPILKKLFKNIDAFVTYCNYGKDTFKNKYDIPGKKIFIAGNSLDNNKIIKKSNSFYKEGFTKRLKEELGIKKERVILFIGQIVKRKNLKSLIISQKMIKNSKLIIVGDGDYREELENFTKKNELDKKVIFCGKHIEDAENYINLADVVILPGLGGLSINHAFLCSKPVITSKADGTALDLIEEGKNGYFLKKGTPKEISEKINKIINNPKKKKRMGVEALKIIKERTGIDKMAKEFNKAFNYVLR